MNEKTIVCYFVFVFLSIYGIITAQHIFTFTKWFIFDTKNTSRRHKELWLVPKKAEDSYFYDSDDYFIYGVMWFLGALFTFLVSFGIGAAAANFPIITSGIIGYLGLIFGMRSSIRFTKKSISDHIKELHNND